MTEEVQGTNAFGIYTLIVYWQLCCSGFIILIWCFVIVSFTFTVILLEWSGHVNNWYLCIILLFYL